MTKRLTPAERLSRLGSKMNNIAEQLRAADKPQLTEAANAIDDGLDKIDSAIRTLESDDYEQGACILTGADGENADDCTTHDHEEPDD